MANTSGQITITKKFKEMTDLYRACRFSEADELLSQQDKYPHQTAAVQAQLFFFNWDFENAIDCILLYYPYLYEWYSENSARDSILMLEFALLHCDQSKRETAVSELERIFREYDDTEGAKPYYVLKIPEIIDIANGKIEHYISEVYAYKLYQEPESPKDPESVIKEFMTAHHIKEQTRDAFLSSEKNLIGLLNVMKRECDAKSFISVYEELEKKNAVSEPLFNHVIRVYQYLGEEEKARKAIIDLVKYQWYPVEWTDIMPVSALAGLDCFHLFNKDFFHELRNIPKGVSQLFKSNCLKLESKNNFDFSFEKTEFSGYELKTKKISTLSVPSGAIVVSDPLMYLDKETLPFVQKVPKGEYDVIAQFAVDSDGNAMITAVKVLFSDAEAAVFRNALTGTESQAEIDELGDEDYFGFAVGAGMAVIIDEKVKKEFLKFEQGWEKKNKGKNFYSDYLAGLFQESYQNDPEYQRDCGDYIDFIIPDTVFHIPMFASGSGDGYYPVYFGFDKDNKVCSLVIEFIEVY